MITKKDEIQDLAYENLEETQRSDIANFTKKYEKYIKKINKGIKKAAKNGNLLYIKKIAPWDNQVIYDEIIFDLREAGYKVDVRNNYDDFYAIIQGSTEEIVISWNKRDEINE